MVDPAPAPRRTTHHPRPRPALNGQAPKVRLGYPVLPASVEEPFPAASLAAGCGRRVGQTVGGTRPSPSGSSGGVACTARSYLAGFRGAFRRNRGRSHCLRHQASLRDLHIYLPKLHGPRRLFRETRHLSPRLTLLRVSISTPHSPATRAAASPVDPGMPNKAVPRPSPGDPRDRENVGVITDREGPGPSNWSTQTRDGSWPFPVPMKLLTAAQGAASRARRRCRRRSGVVDPTGVGAALQARPVDQRQRQGRSVVRRGPDTTTERTPR